MQNTRDFERRDFVLTPPKQKRHYKLHVWALVFEIVHTDTTFSFQRSFMIEKKLKQLCFEAIIRRKKPILVFEKFRYSNALKNHLKK